MNCRMIVTDLDQTLFRDDKSISQRSIAALQRCRDAGIKVVYATGRSNSSWRLLPGELFQGRVISNGAVVYIGDQIIHSRLIPAEVARSFLLACDARGLQTVTQYQSMDYANFDEAAIWTEIVDFSMVDFAEHNLDSEKILVTLTGDADIAALEPYVPDIAYMHVDRSYLMQVMHQEATKAQGLMALARVWGINAADIIAFGDDVNDMDMLIFAGTGIAVANATDAVKACADEICLSNEEDGVAVWLEEHLLL